MKRRKPQKVEEPSKKRERILFFDVVRILCVAIIFYVHCEFMDIDWFNKLIFPDGMGPFNIYSAGLEGYAVYGMIIVSGAVLEYNYQGLEKLHGYLQFLFRRFIRIYPAFWMSLIFGLIAFPKLWQISIPSLLFEFTGFFVVLGQGSGNINNMGWFIATIVSLYLLFPLFSKIIRRYGMAALVGFCFMSWGLRYFILTYNIVPINLFWRWFPLCNAFEFCLGIYLVQASLYPKTVNNSPIIRELSDISYYVFLFHTLVIFYLGENFHEQLRVPILTLTFGNIFLGDLIYYLLVVFTTLAVSWVVMKIDNRFRVWILNRDTVRNFLNVK